MAKPINCSLLLLVLCLIYEVYGYDYPRYTLSKIFGGNDALYGLPLQFPSTASYPKATSEPVATSLSPSPPLKKSCSMKNSLEYNRNRELDRNSEPQQGVYNKQQRNHMDSDDINIGNIQNSMSSRFLSDESPTDLYNSNKQSYKNSGNKNIENSVTSGSPKFKKIQSFGMRSMGPNSLSQTFNEDDSQQNSDGNKPNNPKFKTFWYSGNDFSDIMKKFMQGNSDLSDQKTFSNMGSNMDDFEETGNPKNIQKGSIRPSTNIPSIDSSNDMDSYNIMPQKRNQINYAHSDPTDLDEDKVDEIRNQVLQKSNFYREKYNLRPFTLDNQLNNFAQDWANQMAKSNTFGHRYNNVKYGENLYSSSDLNKLGEKAVEDWYNELAKFKIDFNEATLSTFSPIHHMTQLLWKSSTNLGVGVSKNQNGMYNVVANYSPAGNVQTFFKKNLPDITQEDIDEAKKSELESKQKQRTSWFISTSPKQMQWKKPRLNMFSKFG